MSLIKEFQTTIVDSYASMWETFIDITKKTPKINKESHKQGLSDFSIIPFVYEQELNKKYGIDISDKTTFDNPKINQAIQKTFFNKEPKFGFHNIKKNILKPNSSSPGFSSMKITDLDELMFHITNIHELSYLHYVFGMKNNLNGTFPDYTCGVSSLNLFLSLLEQGYTNAAIFYNDVKNHSYSGLPFSFGENNEPGFILVDPTSDQLFKNKVIAPRNYVFVSLGDKWDYRSNTWFNGRNLFPFSHDDSIYINLGSLRKFDVDPETNLVKISKSNSIREYFKKVFDNIVDVKINSLD